MSDVITIDGPGSSGKNVVGELFARKIGYQFIDTGSMYRIFTAYALNNNISPSDEDHLIEVLKNVKIEFKDEGGKYQVYADGVNITEKLHHPSITANVANYAAIRWVRELAKQDQRNLGKIANTVMTGRDIGSEIFPEAKLKFFLTAKVEIRAKRRFEHLMRDGVNITEEEVLKQLAERDRQDETREASPFRKPDGAIEIDTSNLTVEQSVEKMIEYFHEYKDKSDRGPASSGKA